MRLFTVKDCKPCEEVKEIIDGLLVEVDIVELEERDDKYFLGEDEFPSGGKAFPMLEIIKGQTRNLLCGKEGIVQLLEYGYISEKKLCPYQTGGCKGKLCAKFVVLYKGSIPEGQCADYWNPILGTEIISLLRK